MGRAVSLPELAIRAQYRAWSAMAYGPDAVMPWERPGCAELPEPEPEPVEVAPPAVATSEPEPADVFGVIMSPDEVAWMDHGDAWEGGEEIPLD